MSDDVLKTILSESKKQFDALNERFDKLEGRFDGLEGRFDTLEGRFDKQEGRLDKLEGRFDKLEGRFDKLENRFDKLENEVSRLRISTEDEFAKVREEMATKKTWTRSSRFSIGILACSILTSWSVWRSPSKSTAYRTGRSEPRQRLACQSTTRGSSSALEVIY